MPNTPASTRDMPLPVRIFHAAMEQQLSLTGYAQSLGISSESLRAVLTAQPDDDEAATLDRLAEVYHQPRETLRDQLRITAPQESFGAWLKRNMDGVSQHALRTRVQVDAKTLKRFLNAEMLPDSDQAERISRALYIDRMEIARVVAADMVHQAGADRPVAPTSITVEHGTPAPAVTTEPATTRSRRTQRQNPVSQADPAHAEGAASTEAGVAEPALEGQQPRRAASRRQAGTKMLDAAANGSVSEPDAGAPQHPVAHRRNGTKTADSETTIAPLNSLITQPDDQLAAATDGEAIPTAAATDGETPPAAATTDDETLPAFIVLNQRTTRKQRRVGAGSKQGVTAASASVTIPGAEETPAGEAAVELASELASAPTAAAQPAGLAIEADEALPDTPPSALPAPTLSTPDAPAASTGGAKTPANRRRSAPPAASPTAAPTPAPTLVASLLAEDTTTLQAPPAAIPTAAPAPAPTLVASVLAEDTTTLQLTVDEVRLIRHWRQLHPHGRRATLHFIGSLLVED